MTRGVGEDVVELVRQDAAEGSPVGRFAAYDRHHEKPSLNKAPDGLAIDLGERKDDSITDLGPAERAGTKDVRAETGDVALT